MFDFFSLERVYVTTTFPKLLERFYSHSWLIGWAVNPEKDGIKLYDNHTIAIPCAKSFRIVISKDYHSSTGPHVAKLYYQCHQVKDLLHIATLQINNIPFYSDELRDYLATAIEDKQFYQSPHLAEISIIE